MEIEIPTVETERLVLRAFTEDDVEPLWRLLDDPEVMRFIGDRKVPSREEVWRGVAGWLGHWMLRGYGLWAVDEKASGELVGRIGLLNPLGWPGVEIAYTLGKPWWGRGYATEGAAATMDWAFARLPVDELISLIDPENTGSIGVATKIGERPLRDTELMGHRLHVYGIRRKEWQARRDRRATEGRA